VDIGLLTITYSNASYCHVFKPFGLSDEIANAVPIYGIGLVQETVPLAIAGTGLIYF